MRARGGEAADKVPLGCASSLKTRHWHVFRALGRFECLSFVNRFYAVVVDECYAILGRAIRTMRDAFLRARGRYSRMKALSVSGASTSA